MDKSKTFSHKFIRNLLVSRTFLFFLLLLTIWVALVCVKITNKRYQMAREIENIQQEIEQLKKDNQNLSVLINSFNNSDYLEKEAKRRLNLRKEGEEVVILPDNGTTTLSEDNSALSGGENGQFVAKDGEKAKNKEESNFWKWWRYFFR